MCPVRCLLVPTERSVSKVCCIVHCKVLLSKVKSASIYCRRKKHSLSSLSVKTKYQSLNAIFNHQQHLRVHQWNRQWVIRFCCSKWLHLFHFVTSLYSNTWLFFCFFFQLYGLLVCVSLCQEMLNHKNFSYNSWLQSVSLDSFCRWSSRGIICMQSPKLCWEGSVLLPGWIITIRQSCASRWESPTGSTPVQTQIRI